MFSGEATAIGRVFRRHLRVAGKHAATAPIPRAIQSLRTYISQLSNDGKRVSDTGRCAGWSRDAGAIRHGARRFVWSTIRIIHCYIKYHSPSQQAHGRVRPRSSGIVKAIDISVPLRKVRPQDPSVVSQHSVDFSCRIVGCNQHMSRLVL